MKNKIVIWLLIIILCFIIIACVLDKQPITEASYDDLVELQGIGDILAIRVVDYMDCNPSASVDDLIEINGIGEERLKIIKERYDD